MAGLTIYMSELQIVPAGELPEIEGLKRVDVPAIWNEYHEQATSLKTTAQTLVVKDVKDVATMKLARDTRLALRSIRCESEKRRKELTCGLNAQVKEINGIAGKLWDECEVLEERLIEQEKYAERMEAERKAALSAERGEVLIGFGVNPAPYKLAELSEDQWERLRTALRNAHEAKLAEERQAEEERTAQRKLEAEERARIQQENERLRAENAQREAEVKAERAAAEQQRREAEERAKKEHAALEAAARDREERLTAEMKKVEREARKLREAAEEERLAEEAEKARVQAERIAALKAPDKEKLVAYAMAIRAIELPRMATATGDDVVELIAAQAAKFAAWIEAQAAKL